MFHNNCHELFKAFHKSHTDLIHAVCTELNCEDKIDELCKKLLDTPYTKVKKTKKNESNVKKPKSAYMFFSIDKRAEVVKKNPEAKLGEVSKELGVMWGKVTDKQKAKYEKLAEADKERYQEELKNETEAN